MIVVGFFGTTLSNSGNLEASGGGTLTIRGASSNSGTITVNAGTVSVTGDFGNSGTVALASGNFTVSGNYTQTTGSASTTMSGGTLAATLVDLQGGILAGNGAITGNVRNAAQITLGSATTAGTLTISGTYLQTPAGILNIKIGGPNPADSDQLTIAGAATLGGTWNVSLLGGFTPTSGSTFTPIMFASHGGTTFATTNLDSAFVNPPTYDPTDVELVAN
jgi:autotransporter-associated beta strand protein